MVDVFYVRQEFVCVNLKNLTENHEFKILILMLPIYFKKLNYSLSHGHAPVIYNTKLQKKKENMVNITQYITNHVVSIFQSSYNCHIAFNL